MEVAKKKDQQPPHEVMSRFVSAETNLLRLPFFALQTQGLKTLDGFQASGEDKDRKTGATYRFHVRTTRNTATPYPGPLSRSVHLAILSLLRENGFQNPVSWGWRDFCRRINVDPSGRAEQQIKSAIEATLGVLIRSDNAIYSKSQERPICTESGSLTLYDRVEYQRSRHGSEIAMQNRLWVSEWYLDNLRNRYAAPINYGLWKALDAKSGIASRLYEYFLRAFYAGQDIYTVKYRTLAPFLPVKCLPYMSQAQDQFKSAFDLLMIHRLVRKVEWKQGDDLLLRIHRGSAMTHDDTPATPSDIETTIEITELRNVRPPEFTLAAQFYKDWTGREGQPSRKDQEQAKEMIDKYGEQQAKLLLPKVIERLRKEWPAARTFTAVAKFAPEVADELEAARRRQARDAELLAEKTRHRTQAEQRQQEDRSFYERWQPEWEKLSNAERVEIEGVVSQEHPFANNIPSFKTQLCLRELSKRRSSQ